MPYIGHEPTNAGSFIEIDDFSSTFNGANDSGTDVVAFTLQVGGVDITPNTANVLVMLDGVLQQPPASYSISGSTLTFTEAPASGTDLYAVLIGQSASVGQGTITAAELAISGNGTNNQLLKTDGDGTFSYINQNTVTASTAVTLATARAINGVNFDGSAAITVTAAAGTLSGNTLKSTVTASSLTSVGTLTSLTVDNITLNSSDINNSTGNFTFSHGGSEKLRITSDKVMFTADAKVDANNTRDLGTSGARWKDLYLSGNANVSGDAIIAGKITAGGSDSSINHLLKGGNNRTLILDYINSSIGDGAFTWQSFKANGTEKFRLWGVDGGNDFTIYSDADSCELLKFTNKKAYFGDNIVITNGKGIDFSASSNNSGMTSELLDDYEEGTFQPVMEGSTNQGAFTYVAQVGRYTKIGRMVQIQVYINISACDSVPSGSYMFIRGLPFTNSNDAGVSEGSTFSMNYWTLESSVGTPTGFIFRNNASVLLTHSNANGGASVGILTPSDWATSVTSMSRNIYGSATYYVD